MSSDSTERPTSAQVLGLLNNGAQPAVADPDAAGNTSAGRSRRRPNEASGLGAAGTELDCSRGQCPHLAEGDIRALNEGAGFDPFETCAAQDFRSAKHSLLR